MNNPKENNGNKKITILNGNGNPDDIWFEKYVSDYSSKLLGEGHEVSIHILRNMDIRYCIGCFSCWRKTPGRCVFTDNMDAIYYDAVASDLLVLAAPMVVGFPSKELKKTQDRMIPLLLPDVEFAEDEWHHSKRYDKYPLIGVIIHREADTDADDLRIVQDIYRRFALNFKAKLSFFHTTEKDIKDAADEVSNL